MGKLKMKCKINAKSVHEEKYHHRRGIILLKRRMRWVLTA
jgi:hypothetical protein